MDSLVKHIQDHPGLLYVAATLLPLAAFVLLLLAGGLRLFLHSCRDSMLAATLYRLLGGYTPGRMAAYIATSAIGLAFLLSAYGFVLHTQDSTKLHGGEHHEQKSNQFREAVVLAENKVRTAEADWKDSSKAAQEAEFRYRMVAEAQPKRGPLAAEQLEQDRLTWQRYVGEEKTKRQSLELARAELADAKNQLKEHDSESSSSISLRNKWSTAGPPISTGHMSGR